MLNPNDKIKTLPGKTITYNNNRYVEILTMQTKLKNLFIKERTSKETNTVLIPVLKTIEDWRLYND
jgi:hypothetical protein